MKKSLLSKAQMGPLAAVGLLMAALLLFLGVRENVSVQRSRDDGGYTVLADLTPEEIADPPCAPGRDPYL